jgi:hypothetical protein
MLVIHARHTCMTNNCGWSLWEVIYGFCATDYAVISEHARHTCAKYVYTIVQVWRTCMTHARHNDEHARHTCSSYLHYSVNAAWDCDKCDGAFTPRVRRWARRRPSTRSSPRRFESVISMNIHEFITCKNRIVWRHCLIYSYQFCIRRPRYRPMKLRIRS